MIERNICSWLGIKSPLGGFWRVKLDCFRGQAQGTSRQSEAIKCPIREVTGKLTQCTEGQRRGD